MVKTQRGRSKRLSQSAIKGPVQVIWKQMWFDLIDVWTLPEKIDQQPNTVLLTSASFFDLYLPSLYWGQLQIFT